MNLDEICENDVVCGQLGRPIDNLPGNIQFRVYCDGRRRKYHQLQPREKKEYRMKIYNYITSTLGGRFIQFDKTTNSWSHVAVEKACARIGSRLRAPLFKTAISTWQPPPSTITKKNSMPITAIGAKDVLFGRGSRYYNNKGNIEFRDHCMFMSSAYEACPSNLEKEKLTHQIVSDLLQKKFRFLAYNNEKDWWVEVEFNKVRKKVAERLKQSKKCKHCSWIGCTNWAVEGGVCITHCNHCSWIGCTDWAVGGGVCSRHGAKHKLSSSEGCLNRALNGGVCIIHGAQHKRCSSDGCSKQAVLGGMCLEHGAYSNGQDESTAFGSEFEMTTVAEDQTNPRASGAERERRSVPEEVTIVRNCKAV